jgi:hypothetical protein
MQPLVVVPLLFLIMVANGAPVAAKRIFGRRFAIRLDGSLRFVDGKPLLGTSKTVRGMLASLLVTTACAPLVGLEWTIGLAIAAATMIGDLFSSFVKRRLGLTPGARAIGLDQIPESLFPLLAVRDILALTAWDVAAGVAIFFIGDILLSPLFQRLGFRDRSH